MPYMNQNYPGFGAKDKPETAAPAAAQAPAPTPLPDIAQTIMSWAPSRINGGDVRALLRQVFVAAKVLKLRTPQGYAPVAQALKLTFGEAGRAIGRVPDAQLLTPNDTASVLQAIAGFWQAAHGAAAASNTPLDVRVTQAVLQAAQKRPATDVQTAFGAGTTAIPSWGWGLLGLLIGGGAVGAAWYFLHRRASLAGVSGDGSELPELFDSDEPLDDAA